MDNTYEIINASINLSQIDKAKLIKGEKGVYLNISIAKMREADKFENTHTIWQSASKEENEERERTGVKPEKRYCGKGRVYQVTPTTTNLPENEFDDLPF